MFKSTIILPFTVRRLPLYIRYPIILVYYMVIDVHELSLMFLYVFVLCIIQYFHDKVN